MRKVLFIAYYFPPIGGSGVQHATKFVRYLHEFGGQPTVITTNRTYGAEGVDDTLLADIPSDVRVMRVPTPRPQPVAALQRIVGWRPAAPQVATLPSVSSSLQSAPKPSLMKRLRRALLAPLYAVQEPPIDSALFWSTLRIAPLARRLIQHEQIDVIFITSPPFSPLLTGWLLKTLTGRSWVADFRDPWTSDTKVHTVTGWRKSFERYVASGSGRSNARNVSFASRAIAMICAPLLAATAIVEQPAEPLASANATEISCPG